MSDLRDIRNVLWQMNCRGSGGYGKKWRARADSPRLHAASFSVPVLFVLGVDDWTVEVDQSQLMAKALQDANKPYKLVTIKGVDHYFQTQDCCSRRSRHSSKNNSSNRSLRIPGDLWVRAGKLSSLATPDTAYVRRCGC